MLWCSGLSVFRKRRVLLIHQRDRSSVDLCLTSYTLQHSLGTDTAVWANEKEEEEEDEEEEERYIFLHQHNHFLWLPVTLKPL